jgi:hypothetical protein
MQALKETNYKHSEIQYCLPMKQLRAKIYRVKGKRVESMKLYTSKLSAIDVSR